MFPQYSAVCKIFRSTTTQYYIGISKNVLNLFLKKIKYCMTLWKKSILYEIRCFLFHVKSELDKYWKLLFEKKISKYNLSFNYLCLQHTHKNDFIDIKYFFIISEKLWNTEKRTIELHPNKNKPLWLFL